MKRHLLKASFVCLAIVAVGITSCKKKKKDDEEETTPSNKKPSVSISSPVEDDMYIGFTATREVTYSANASDEDGSIAKVEFYVDGEKIGEDAASPYEMTSSVDDDFHAVYAIATDDKGESTQSVTVNFTYTVSVMNTFK